jgi:hypothetical protein
VSTRYGCCVGFWETFNGFNRSTRVVLIASLVLGAAALAVGVILDETKPIWLYGLNYIPNIWAGLTGFLIGAPFALVVLATFTVQREERTAQDKVNRLSQLAWEKFRNSVYELCTDERIRGLHDHAYSVDYQHNQIYKQYRGYINTARTYVPEKGQYRGITPQEAVEFQGDLRKEAERFENHISKVRDTVGSQYDLQIHLVKDQDELEHARSVRSLAAIGAQSGMVR